VISVALLTATTTDVRQSADGLSDREGLKERVASRLDRIEAAAGRRMTRGTGVLAFPFHIVITLSGLIIFWSTYFPSGWQAAYSDRQAFNADTLGTYT